MTEYAVTVRMDQVVYVTADNVAEATEKGRARSGVTDVMKVEVYEPGTPCTRCNPSGIFRYSPVGETCICKGKGFT